MTDFKINSIIQNEKGKTVVFSIYQGAITTEDEWDDKTKSLQPVTRYRRTEKLLTQMINLGVDSDIRSELKNKLAERAALLKTEVIPQQKNV